MVGIGLNGCGIIDWIRLARTCSRTDITDRLAIVLRLTLQTRTRTGIGIGLLSRTRTDITDRLGLGLTLQARTRTRTLDSV